MRSLGSCIKTYRHHFNMSQRLQAVSWKKGPKQATWRKQSELHWGCLPYEKLFQPFPNSYLPSPDQDSLKSLGKANALSKALVPVHNPSDAMWDLGVSFLLFLLPSTRFSPSHASSSPLHEIPKPPLRQSHFSDYWKCAKRALTMPRH